MHLTYKLKREFATMHKISLGYETSRCVFNGNCLVYLTKIKSSKRIFLPDYIKEGKHMPAAYTVRLEKPHIIFMFIYMVCMQSTHSTHKLLSHSLLCSHSQRSGHKISNFMNSSFLGLILKLCS